MKFTCRTCKVQYWNQEDPNQDDNMYRFSRRIWRLSVRRDISRRRFLSSIPQSGGDELWVPSTYVQQFKRKTTLWVSDLTTAYWCEKQLEYKLLLGYKTDNDAMKAGRKFHKQHDVKIKRQQQEYFKNIRHYRQYAERPIQDAYHWINKFANALEQLFSLRDYETATELMLITSIEGQWVIGYVDKIQYHDTYGLTFTEMKTRQSNSFPRDEQLDKDKFQLMLYKLMFDTLKGNVFPLDYFFAHHDLIRETIVPEEVVKSLKELGYNQLNTLEELVCLYIAEFRLWLTESVTLRVCYHYIDKRMAIDKPISLSYDLKSTLRLYQTCMKMWNCERATTFTEHNYKCNYCAFSDSCPGSKVVNKRKIMKPLITREHELKRLANIAFFSLVSQFKSTLTELLISNGFLDITSRILGERQPLCVLKSRHHYKEVAMCTNYLSVEQPQIFWQGAIFTVEDFDTLENPCYFTCFDAHMVIGNNYSEVMDMVDRLYLPTFDKIKEMSQKELEAITNHHPFETLKFLPKTPRITYEEGIQMLKEVGEEVVSLDKKSERKLGQLIREKYHSDFYILHRFPMVVSPFYTTPCADDPSYGNSFSVFLRGKLISGGQRINNLKLLEKHAREYNPEDDQWKEISRNGAPPHVGFRMRLERMVRIFCGLPPYTNIF